MPSYGKKKRASSGFNDMWQNDIWKYVILSICLHYAEISCVRLFPMSSRPLAAYIPAYDICCGNVLSALMSLWWSSCWIYLSLVILTILFSFILVIWLFHSHFRCLTYRSTCCTSHVSLITSFPFQCIRIFISAVLSSNENSTLCLGVISPCLVRISHYKSYACLLDSPPLPPCLCVFS